MKQSLLAVLALASSTCFGHRHDNHVMKVLKNVKAGSAGSSAQASFYNSAVKDHFDTSIATAKEPKWSQRYYADGRFWKGSGYPVFLYIGGEGPQGPPSSSLFMWTLAEEHGALMLALEHRFYGESRPTADLSDDSLVLLTSEQALADLARFVTYVNSVDPLVAPDAASTPPLNLSATTANSRWVTFGGSYPGSLATWFKTRYPALTSGTVGSSAPVFAEYDFAQYAEVVGAALADGAIGGSAACAAAVATGVGALVKAVGPSGHTAAASLPAALEPCTPIKTELDLGAGTETPPAHVYRRPPAHKCARTPTFLSLRTSYVLLHHFRQLPRSCPIQRAR